MRDPTQPPKVDLPNHSVSADGVSVIFNGHAPSSGQSAPPPDAQPGPAQDMPAPSSPSDDGDGPPDTSEHDTIADPAMRSQSRRGRSGSGRARWAGNRASQSNRTGRLGQTADTDQAPVARRNLLHWITGYQPLPTDHWAERLLYSALGISVLVTALLAFFSMSVVMAALGDNVPDPLRFVIPLGWLFIVFSVELLIVRQIYYDRRGLGAGSRIGGGLLSLMLFLARLGLASALALLVAEPLIVFAFADRVDEQVAIDRQDKIAARASTIRLQALQQWFSTDGAKVEEYRRSVQNWEIEAGKAREQLSLEVDGDGDCAPGVKGKGPCWEQAQQSFIKADTAAKEATAQCEAFVADAQDRRDQALVAADLKVAELSRQPPEEGILARLTALRNIERLRHQETQTPTTDSAGAAGSSGAPSGAAGATPKPPPSLALSCNPTVPLPTPDDLRAKANVATSSESAADGQRIGGISKEDAQYVFLAHWGLLAVLLIIDLFPLLTKQSLRNSQYAHRLKSIIREEQAARRVITEQASADARVKVLAARASVRASRPDRRGGLRLAKLAADAGLEKAMRRYRFEQRAQEADDGAELAGRSRQHARVAELDDIDVGAELAERRRHHAHLAELADLRRKDEARRLRNELLFSDDDSTQPFPRPTPYTKSAGGLQIGDEIDGRWRLRERLHDKPEYAVLWLAEDLQPDRLRQSELPSQLAVMKFIYPRASNDDGFGEELRTVEQIHGGAQHIAPILGTGTVRDSDGNALLHYFVQPYYPLGSLDQYLQQFTPNLLFCLAVTDQVLRGLDWAHFEAGRLHLDIKPMNIVMAQGRRGGGRGDDAYIIDWGLATPLALSERRQITARGPGTPWFGAPEQFLRSANGVDGRCQESDVYGVGATLYSLLTNRPPLQREFFAAYPEPDLLDWVRFLGTDPPPTPTPVHVIVPQIPRPVSDLVQRWLSFEPSARVDPYDVSERHQGAAAQALKALRKVAREVSDQLDMTIGPPPGEGDYDDHGGDDHDSGDSR